MNRVSLISRSHPARADAADGSAPHRYWAYLSYSHRDEADAKWLHNALEKFTVPPALVGRETAHGPIPKSFAPIFRDRQELAASDDLGSDIREALAGSRFLIVLCSPAAAASRWTNEEIGVFKRLHPRGEILAAIIAGEPWASLMPGREDEECFPPALCVQFDRRGRPTTKRAEPIAADLREGRDGRRMGMLKIAAGMLNVGLDDLVHRDAQRRSRRLRMVAGGSFLGMAVASGLAVFAFDARDAARDQRREAEGLVGFMLGDLRDKLEPIGRLDALDAVGTRTLEYFEKQDKSELSDAALAQRSKALTMMGEIAHLRGDLNGALARYREAMASTAEALRRLPDEPQRLFDHAQNVFWVGYIAYHRGQLDQAEARFREYKRLADRMIAADPLKPEWKLEAIYADTNLGTLQLNRRQYRAASASYQRVLEAIEPLAAAKPGDEDYAKQLSQALAYLADSREREGELDEALAQRERQLSLLQQSAAGDLGNNRHKRDQMSTQRALGRLFASRGEMAAAEDHLTAAAELADEIVRTEPGNTEWAQAAASAYLDLGEMKLGRNQVEQAGTAVRSGCNLGARLLARDRTVVEWRLKTQGRCLIARGRVALKRGATMEAAALADAAAALARSELGSSPSNLDARFALVDAQFLRGHVAEASDDRVAAEGAWRAALASWPKGVEESPRELAMRAYMLRRTGQRAQADAIAARLAVIGFRHPEFSKT